MQFFVGTSGYSYKEWKGSFYPEKLAAKDMLRFYGEHFDTVEINNTFYRMPKASVLESWAEQVPDGFRFVLKASRKITHFKRLKETAEETEYLLRTASALGPRLGPILFQLPPNFKKDVERLAAFLEQIPGTMRAAFEFRHDSWFDDEVYATLRENGVALCLADQDDAPEPDVVSTANWGYLRLRRTAYAKPRLTEWIERAHDASWTDSYVFFKHEDEGTGPKLAKKFLDVAGATR